MASATTATFAGNERESVCICARVNTSLFDVFDKEIGATMIEWYRSLVSGTAHPVTKWRAPEESHIFRERNIAELLVCMQPIDLRLAENPYQS